MTIFVKRLNAVAYNNNIPIGEIALHSLDPRLGFFFMEELFVDVKNYEGLYQISNFGKIKCLEKSWITGRGKGKLHTQKEKILKPILSKFGYYRISLSKNGKYKKYFIHRLVALHFCIGNKELQVNHIDGNKINNIYTNLEFVTASENSIHAFKLGLKKISKKNKIAVKNAVSGSKNINATKVLNLKNGVIYDTIKEAAEKNNYNHKTFANYLRNKKLNDFVYVRTKNSDSNKKTT